MPPTTSKSTISAEVKHAPTSTSQAATTTSAAAADDDDEYAASPLYSIFCGCLGKRTNHKSAPRTVRTDGQGGGSWPEGFISAADQGSDKGPKVVHETTTTDKASHHNVPPTKKTPVQSKKDTKSKSKPASTTRPKISQPYDFRHVSSGTPFAEPTTTQVQQLPPALMRGQRLYRDLELRNFSPPSETHPSSNLFSFSKKTPNNSPVLGQDDDKSLKRSKSMPPPPKFRREPDNESASAWASFFLPTWPAKPEMGHRRSTSASFILETSQSPVPQLNNRSISALSFHVPRKPLNEGGKTNSIIYENGTPLKSIPHVLNHSKSCTELSSETASEQDITTSWYIPEKKVLLPGQGRHYNRHDPAPSYSACASDSKTPSNWVAAHDTIYEEKESLTPTNVYGQSKSCTALLDIDTVTESVDESDVNEKKVLLPGPPAAHDPAPSYSAWDSKNNWDSKTAWDSKTVTKKPVTESTHGDKITPLSQSNIRGHSRSHTASDFRTSREIFLARNNSRRMSRKGSVSDVKRQALRRSRSSTASQLNDTALRLELSTVPLPSTNSVVVPYRFKFQPQRQSLFTVKSHTRRNSEISSSVDSMIPRAQSPPSEFGLRGTALRAPPGPRSPAGKRKSFSQVASWLFSSSETSRCSSFMTDPVVTPLTHPAVVNKKIFPTPAHLLNRRFSDGSMAPSATNWSTDDDRTIQSVWSLTGTSVGMGRDFFVPRSFPADRKRYSTPLTTIGAAV